jgi:hypothetical protein
VLLCVLALPAAGADEETLLALEVKAAPKDAKPVAAKYPKHYEKFEQRIKELDGKPILDLVGTKLTIQLQNCLPGPGKKKQQHTGLDFTRAILDGRVVPDSKMVYDLQSAEECLVKTPQGDFRVGLYYAPVGYVVLPGGESYWFFFDKKDGER